MTDYTQYRFGDDGKLLEAVVSHSDADTGMDRYPAPFGYTFAAPPEYAPETQVPVWDGSQWVIHDLSEYKPTLEEAKEAKLAEIADARWQAETGGLSLPDGTVIKTDRESQALLTGAAFSLYADPTATVEWKGDKGKWVDLDSKQVLVIAGAVRAHVQGCFSKERDLSEKVNACGTVEEVQLINW